MKIVVTILLVVGLIYAGVTVASSAMTNRAENRVRGVMEGWAKGGVGAGVDIQGAVSFWAEGVSFIADADRLAGASDDFDTWRRAKRLYRPIRQYAITQVVPNQRFLPDEFIAHVSIDGEAYFMTVRGRAPIAWAEKGTFE